MKLEDKLLKKYPQLNKKTVALVIKKVKSTPKNQRGAGFLDRIVNKAVDLYNTALRKKKDKRDRQLKDGETHALFFNDDGAIVRARFAGPNTKLVENLKEMVDANNDNISLAIADENFVSDSDKVALAHDIRYTLSDDPEKVREADLKFVNKLKENMKRSGGSPKVIFNNFVPYSGVRGKMLMEDTGLIKKGSFATGGIEKYPKEEQQLLTDTLKHLEMQGYGKRTTAINKFLKENSAALLGVSGAVIASLIGAAVLDKQNEKNKFNDGSLKMGEPAKQKPIKAFVFNDLAQLDDDERKQVGSGGNPKNRPPRRRKKIISKWAKHVHKYANELNCSYRDAIPHARLTYKPS